MNAEAFRNRYFRRFRNSGAPIEGVFELTGRCNFNCKMCYVHTKSNAEFLKTEKDGEWWISQINAACERGMLFALLTGGECLLHPNFRQIYTHLYNKGVYVRINTNGFLLTENVIDFFKSAPPLEIQLSLYASDDIGYEKVTGLRVFGQIEQAITRTRAANLNLRIAVTPNSFAPEETERIIKYLKQIRIPYTINPALFTPYSETAAQTLSDNSVNIKEKITYLRTVDDVQYEPIPVENLPIAGGGRADTVQGLRCNAGHTVFTITHDGCMMPCTSMYHLRIPLDSDKDFATAWERMLQIGREYPMPIECEGCAYRKVCLPCPILRGGQVGNGHCDPEVCKMTRQLVAEGIKRLD